MNNTSQVTKPGVFTFYPEVTHSAVYPFATQFASFYT